MGKVVRFTGSKLLGSELRQLRGGRTLDDVVELSRTKLRTQGFRAIGKGTLSDIENGRALPNIESVFALSALYQIPATRFLNLLLEENSASQVPPPESDQGLHDAFVAAMNEQRWSDALALAHHGIARHATGWPRLQWRLNRAVVIGALGMRVDAINDLTACLESEDLPEREAFKVHRELTRMHVAVGQLKLADWHLSEAQRLLPRDTAPLLRAQLLESRIALALTRRTRELKHSLVPLDEVEAWIREARLLLNEGDRTQSLMLDVYQARVHAMRGDVRKAAALLRTTARAAEESDRPAVQTHALFRWGQALLDADVEAGCKLLVKAGELASTRGLPEQAFTAFLLLAQRAGSEEQREHFRRKCQRLQPMIDESSPAAREFQAMGRRETQ